VTCISIARRRLGKHILTEANARNNIKKGSVERSEFSEVERVQLKKNSFERVVVENWVEFWRWQSKVIEKKRQEMN
jgi:hypothetical protein